MVQVFHMNNFQEYFYHEKGTPWIDTGILVAEVDTNILDVAYEKTNHISHDWKENQGVVSFANKNRSTSVGDVLFFEDQTFIVEDCGFHELTGQDKQNICVTLPSNYKEKIGS